MLSTAGASRFMQRYAKKYSAGAFAMPTAGDLERHGWQEFTGTDPDQLTIIVPKVLLHGSHRRDWTGRTYELPPGTRVVTHIAHAPGAPIPDLGNYDVVYAYIEDTELTNALRGQGRTVWTTTVSAASELIAAWTFGDPMPVEPVDRVNLARVQFPATTPRERADILVEVDRLTGWADDYPYYSDGSWSALSLRGYDPADPTWGVKPAEMGKAWHAAHPDADNMVCDWTVLAERMPVTTALVKSVGWWANLERVRLLRMGKGHLGRHTDITDRNGGTRDGQVVRFHVPLRTAIDITLHTWDLDGRESCVALEPWKAWYLDTRKPHAVTNPTTIDRVHLVADVIVDPEVRRHIVEWGQ